MHNDPWSNARVPDSGDACDIWDYFRNSVGDLSPLAEPYFTTTAARDTALTNWVAAGNTTRDGLRCYVQGIGAQRYLSSAWVSLKSTGSLTPSSGWGAGYGNYSLPSYTLTYDGIVMLGGMVQRTGANVVLNGTSGSPVTFATLPTALKPTTDIAPGGAYFGSASPVQTVDARLYVAQNTTALQVTPMDAGTYTVYTTQGFVNLDGVSWRL